MSVTGKYWNHGWQFDKYVLDINNYPWSAPCNLNRASRTLSKTFSTGPVPDQFTFLLRPAERFGACSNAIHGGYAYVGIFNNQLDLSRGINLQIQKHSTSEDYVFLLLPGRDISVTTSLPSTLEPENINSQLQKLYHGVVGIYSCGLVQIYFSFRELVIYMYGNTKCINELGFFNIFLICCYFLYISYLL